MHRGPPSPPPRPIHPIIPPALYDQSILFYTASHETSRPYGSTVRFHPPLFLLQPPMQLPTSPLPTQRASSSAPQNSFRTPPGFSFSIEPTTHLSSPHSYFAVPKTFLLLGQPIGASFRFTLIDAFSQMLLLLLFIPFVFSFFPFFYVISFQSPHPIDTSPYILRENCRLYRLRPQNSFFFSIPSPPTRFQPVFSPPIISFFCIRELFRELDSGREKIIGFIVNAIADIRGSALSRPRVP